MPRPRRAPKLDVGPYEGRERFLFNMRRRIHAPMVEDNVESSPLDIRAHLRSEMKLATEDQIARHYTEARERREAAEQKIGLAMAPDQWFWIRRGLIQGMTGAQRVEMLAALREANPHMNLHQLLGNAALPEDAWEDDNPFNAENQLLMGIQQPAAAGMAWVNGHLVMAEPNFEDEDQPAAHVMHGGKIKNKRTCKTYRFSKQSHK